MGPGEASLGMARGSLARSAGQAAHGGAAGPDLACWMAIVKEAARKGGLFNVEHHPGGESGGYGVGLPEGDGATCSLR
jgi:hypothetical protein